MSGTFEVVDMTQAAPGGDAKRVITAQLDRLFPSRRIRKVLFVAPPDADSSMFNYATGKRARYSNYPPYGVGMIATHLRKLGVTVQVANLNYEVLKACCLSRSEAEFDFDRVWKEKLRETLEGFQPDLVGVTCMFSLANNSAREICREIRRLAPQLPLSIGGVHVTNCFMNERVRGLLFNDFSSADLFFLYEAELAVCHLVRAVNRDMDAETLYQLCISDGPAKLHFPERVDPTAEDLSVIPAHDLITPRDLGTFGKIGAFYSLKGPETRFGNVLANRGCRAQCTFCSVRNFNGVGVRRRSVKSVIEELRLLRDEYDIDHVMWLDDDFLFDTEETLKLFDEMIRAKLGITWDCTNGVIAHSCTDEVIEKAAESGCIGLVIGVESGSPEILKQIKKPGNPETFTRAAAVLRRHRSINSRAFLMLGFPGETYRMILDTINLALAMNMDWYSITILQPLPNTPIFDTMAAAGLIKDVNFQDIRFSNGVYGKMRAKATRLDMLETGFKDAFKDIDLDSVPAGDKLDDIWAYMNFHLNFKRLFHEDRRDKLDQMYKYVRNIAEIVAPESGFAMYFTGLLQHRLTGQIDPKTIAHIEDRLVSSPYWASRFREFNLSADHLKTGSFPTPPAALG